MQQQTLTPAPSEANGTGKKPFAAPAVRREARLALVTAGSFDLFIPG